MVHDMVHDLRKNPVEVLVFLCGARVHQKSTQGAQNILHQNFKFFESWNRPKNCFIPLISCLNSDEIV